LSYDLKSDVTSERPTKILRGELKQWGGLLVTKSKLPVTLWHFGLLIFFSVVDMLS